MRSFPHRQHGPCVCVVRKEALLLSHALSDAHLRVARVLVSACTLVGHEAVEAPLQNDGVSDVFSEDSGVAQAGSSSDADAGAAMGTARC